MHQQHLTEVTAGQREQHSRAAGSILRAIAEEQRSVSTGQSVRLAPRSFSNERTMPANAILGHSSTEVGRLPLQISPEMIEAHHQSPWRRGAGITPTAKQLYVALSSPDLPVLPLPLLPPSLERQISAGSMVAFDVAWPGNAVGLEDRISRA